MFDNRPNIYKTLFDLNKRENIRQEVSSIDFKDKDGNDVEVFRIITYKENFVSIQDFLYAPNHSNDDGDVYDSIEEWTLDIPHNFYNDLIAIVGEDTLLKEFAVLKLMKDNGIVVDKLQKWFLKRYDIKFLTAKAKELGHIDDTN